MQRVRCHASETEVPAWLSWDLLLELKQKRKVYSIWKQQQTTWQGYRNGVHHCREKIHVAEASLEFKLASTIKVTKRAF